MKLSFALVGTTSFKKNLNFMVVYSCVGGWVGLGEGQDQKSANFKSCEVLEVVLKAKFQDGEFQKGFGIRKQGKQFKNSKRTETKKSVVNSNKF